MKVNMTPNPLDVVTIHASQGDTEARQWEFELHNNGELIDTSDVKEQMFFKAYKGGTEQILPENTSTPTTSPFLGDIQYPDATRTGQEFLYRQSPTEEDGNAKIKSLYGNTLVWNQLVPMDWVSTGTFSDGLSVTNNNDGTYTINGTASQSRFPTRNTEIYGIQGHKYYIQLLSSQGKAIITQNGSNVYVYSSVIYTAQNNNAFIIYFNANTYSNEKIIPMIIDLTQMGLDSLTVKEFTSLFPLPYYAYNQGTLLSFMGNGIKTVGFNQWDEVWESGAYNQQTGEKMSASNIWRCTNYISVIPNETYYFKVPITVRIFWYDGNYNFLGTDTVLNGTKTVPSGAMFLTFHLGQASYSNDVCINISSSRNGEYEPYTSSTLSLPISTYFPTGMKSAGSVYDELTESKAITRVGSITLDGTQTTTFEDLSAYRVGYEVPNMLPFTGGVSTVDDGIISNYLPNASNDITYAGNKGIHRRANGTRQIIVGFGQSSGLDTLTEINEYLSAHPLVVYYPLATETETEITTASLVTENAEIPLSNEDGTLIGKCTEELSAEPGFHDAKIKLANEDGECYSNKIQLHIERSPQ